MWKKVVSVALCGMSLYADAAILSSGLFESVDTGDAINISWELHSSEDEYYGLYIKNDNVGSLVTTVYFDGEFTNLAPVTTGTLSYIPRNPKPFPDVDVQDFETSHLFLPSRRSRDGYSGIDLNEEYYFSFDDFESTQIGIRVKKNYGKGSSYLTQNEITKQLSIPEPGITTLLGITGGCFLLRRKRNTLA